MTIWPIILFAILVPLILIAAFLQYRAAVKRQAALEAYAGTHGLSFRESDGDMEREFRSFTPFGRGSSRVCKNILTGRMEGLDVRMFTYRYTIKQDKRSSTYNHRVLAVRMPLDGHDLLVRPEHIGDRIRDALGGEDIDFESDEFSRAFWVKCQDRRFAYDIITPRMQEWLLASGKRQWQWHGNTLLLHEDGVLSVDDVAGLLAPAQAFVGHLPRHRLAEASV